MKKSRVLSSRISIVLAISLIVVGYAPSLRGQEGLSAENMAPATNAAAAQGGGLASDWSHRHLIFSGPGTADEARQNGTYDRWLRIAADPRYAMQRMKRGGAGPGLSAEHRSLPEEPAMREAEAARDEEDAGEAKTPIREEDSPRNALSRGSRRATMPAPLQGFKPRRDPRPPEFRPRSREAKNRFEKDWSENIGSGGTVGMGNFPATFTSTSASCTADFAVYNTSLAGSSSQASIVAFNQLYSGCTPQPKVYWAFDTGGTIQTSVALSLDGTQVAFVQTDNSTGDADFVVLKWAASGSLASPTALTSNGSYPSCTAPCMIVIHFNGSPTDTYSSPYIDYSTGNAYVGDDAGAIHKFANVFSGGTPAEVTTSWPVTLNTSTDAALGSPVYDGVSGKIFVGDYLANMDSKCEPGIVTPEGQCGYLYSVSASSGTVVRSAQLDYNLGIYDSPIVDSSAETVYAFIGADSSTNCSSGPCAGVFQFSTGFAAGSSGTEATVGAGYLTLFSGAFDNQYFTSTSGSPTGHLYVVGGTGPQNNTLYAIPITSNVMGSAIAGPQVADNYTNGGDYAAGLQVTEFCNNGSSECTASEGTDYLFLSVLEFGRQFSSNPCPSPGAESGCIMGFAAPASGVVATSATPNGTLQEAGGASGIVVDNGASGASNIYFSTLLSASADGQTCTTSGGSGGCAVSATQAALQ